MHQDIGRCTPNSEEAVVPAINLFLGGTILDAYASTPEFCWQPSPRM